MMPNNNINKSMDMGSNIHQKIEFDDDDKYNISIDDLKCDKTSIKESIPFKGIKNIYYQMKNIIKGGFFCKIPYKNNILPFYITSYKIINENTLANYNQIIISLDIRKITKSIKIDKNKKIYMNKEYDITMIEISKDDSISDDYFFELDENVLNDNSELIYENKPLYIFDYTQNDEPSLFFCSLNKIVGYKLIHDCEMRYKGMPILNLQNNKVIGMNTDQKLGTFLKYVLNDFNGMKNQIKITLNIEAEDINKKIYFLDSTSNNFKDLNENNTKLFINNEKIKFKNYFIPKKKGKYSILLKLSDIYIKNCNFMFYNCDKITYIDLSLIPDHNIINMTSMFFGCTNLKYVDLYSINTKNVIDMSYMFNGCENLNLINLNDSFRTKNVTSMKNMFCGCQNLKKLFYQHLIPKM